MSTVARDNLSDEAMPAMAVVHFEYLDSHAESVCLGGTFNDWHPTGLPMVASGRGLWQLDLPLAPGVYEYQFFVDGHWRPGARSGEMVENEFGGLNAVVRVPEKQVDASGPPRLDSRS